MNAKSIGGVILAVAMVCGAVVAPNVTAAQQASQKPPAEPPVPVRVRLTVDRVEGDKTTSSTPFELIVKANVGGTTSLNHGRSVPVVSTTFAGATREETKSYVYQSIGSNLHISGLTTTDKLISFELMVDISTVEPATGPAIGPSFRRFSMQMVVTVPPGQATLVATSTDRMTGETAKLTVLAETVK